jgi:8-oxo-dGTP pyrophosphatase MutT (NUDIX family)
VHDDPRLTSLARVLEQHPPRSEPPALEGVEQPSGDPIAHASVALVVRPRPTDLELLVIERAARPGDPWSGHMAFPGGRRGPEDLSPRETAERETWEEVGIPLSSAGRLLGGLDAVWPRSGAPAIVVSPFVFAVPSDSGVTPNHEVAAAFWIPLRLLSGPGAATEYLHALASGEELRFPAIAYESRVIWGLTHRIMTGFLDLVRLAIAGEEEAR